MAFGQIETLTISFTLLLAVFMFVVSVLGLAVGLVAEIYLWHQYAIEKVLEIYGYETTHLLCFATAAALFAGTYLTFTLILIRGIKQRLPELITVHNWYAIVVGVGAMICGLLSMYFKKFNDSWPWYQTLFFCFSGFHMLLIASAYITYEIVAAHVRRKLVQDLSLNDRVILLEVIG